VTIVFGAAALSASHPPLPPRCGDEIFDASSLRLDIPANCRARLATPGVQGDGLWRYQHVRTRQVRRGAALFEYSAASGREPTCSRCSP